MATPLFDGSGGDDRLEGRAGWIELAGRAIRQRPIGIVEQGLPLRGGIGSQQQSRGRTKASTPAPAPLPVAGLSATTAPR